MVFHFLDHRCDRLVPVFVFPAVNKRVCLIDEQDISFCLIKDTFDLDCRLTGVFRNQIRTADLDQVSLAEDPVLFHDSCKETRYCRFRGSRIAQERQIQIDVFDASPLFLCQFLDICKCHDLIYSLLDVIQPNQLVQLFLCCLISRSRLPGLDMTCCVIALAVTIDILILIIFVFIGIRISGLIRLFLLCSCIFFVFRL